MTRTTPIRKSARGEECTLRLPGCGWDDCTVVLAHINDGRQGVGLKASDLSAVYACASCHEKIGDGSHLRLSRTNLSLIVLAALQRTHRRLVEKGLIEVKR